MAIILSISEANGVQWAAGPHGLFQVGEEELRPVLQPMERLACTLALSQRVLVGGGPYGVAYTADHGQNWQAAWTSGCHSAVLVMAADPNVAHSGVILAGTEGEGILRTTDRGGYWSPCNFGLRNYMVLSLAWAPLAPQGQWPQREIVFAATEEGVYRSPNAGRGWRRAECPELVYQILAVSPNFHEDGVVMAGSEMDGLWRSADGGRSFSRLASAPEQVNALCAWDGGWLLSAADELWHSADGVEWQPVTDSAPVLVLRPGDGVILAGDEDGLTALNQVHFAPQTQYAAPEMV
ncbi:MAG: hypothetical protein R2873_06495 [Caldilineaceae bacterium]